MEKVINRILIILIIVLGLCTVFYSRKSYELGRLCGQYRERIAEAERTNHELGRTVGQCKSVCVELRESVGRNIQTARDAVETIEELRVQVQCLESITGDFDWDRYYSDTDSYLGIEH